MLKKTILLFVLLISVSIIGFSQNKKSSKHKKSKSKTQKVSALYVQVPIPLLNFDVKDFISGKKLHFEPTPHYNLGAGLKIGGFNILIGTGVAVYKQNLAVTGKTRYTDIQLGFNSKIVTNDFYYQNFKGFYVKNSANYLHLPASNPYLLRPDIRITLMGFNTLFILNPKYFNFKNTFGFNRMENSTGASFLLGAYYSLFQHKGDSVIIASPFKPYFNPTSYFRQTTEQTYGLNFGFGFRMVILKHLNFTIAAIEGVGLYDINYVLETNQSFASKPTFSTKSNLRLNLGYEIGRLFIGGTFNLDWYFLDSKTYSTINYSNGKAVVFVGFRLDRMKG